MVAFHLKPLFVLLSSNKVHHEQLFLLLSLLRSHDLRLESTGQLVSQKKRLPHQLLHHGLAQLGEVLVLLVDGVLVDSLV